MADLSVPLAPATVTVGQTGHAALHTQERDYLESLRQFAQAAPTTYARVVVVAPGDPAPPGTPDGTLVVEVP